MMAGRRTVNLVLFVCALCMTFPPVASPVNLRGRILSSVSNTPIDSAIPRLLTAGISTYTQSNGTFTLGASVGIRQTVNKAETPGLFRKNGDLCLDVSKSPYTGFSLYSLNGRVVKTVVFDKSAGNQLINISRLIQGERNSRCYVLSLEKGKAVIASYKIAIVDRTISVLGGNTSFASSTMHQSISASVLAADVAVDTLHIWKAGYKPKTIVLSQLTDSLTDISLDTQSTIRLAPAPLFRDPIYDGAADPTISWNVAEKAFWIFYTNRRATCTTCSGVSWVFGTDIGICSSFDGGASWQYRGVAKLTGKNNLNWNTTVNTFWAPDVVYDNGVYHMYVTITPGVLTAWNESIAAIVHLSSTNPLNGWSYDTIPYKTIHSGIDAAVRKLGDGKWHMWGKFADFLISTDLKNWTPNGTAPTGGEGPFVFYWKNYYWMLRDPTASDNNAGIMVKRSADGLTWTNQSTNILAGLGTRSGDSAGDGKHASVVLQGDKAYIIYFIQELPTRSNVQAAPLAVTNGVLSADRNTPFDFVLRHFDDSLR